MGSVEGQDVVRSQAFERASRENNHSVALPSGFGQQGFGDRAKHGN
jgi:hypothetical protein